jgi:hypothetical protein
MPIQIIPTGESGHDEVEFAVDDEADVQAAMDRFNDLVKNQKRIAVALGQNGEPSTLLRAFDPTVERTAFMPQRKGG